MKFAGVAAVQHGRLAAIQLLVVRLEAPISSLLVVGQLLDELGERDVAVEMGIAEHPLSRAVRRAGIERRGITIVANAKNLHTR